MHLDGRGYVSIVELIVFVPCLILGVKVCLRHGFKRTSGWIFILILSAVRIVGAVCQLLSYDKPTEGLIKATLILDSVGIAPLLLAVLGILSRLIDWINASIQNPNINSKFFRINQLVIGISLILGILGVTSKNSQAADGTFVPPTLSKIGIVLNVVVFLVITIIFILSLPHSTAVPGPERLLKVHIPVALAAISIRLLYSALCIFVHNSTFSLFNGSIAAYILMAIAEEFIVVIITLVLGFKLRPISVEADGKIINFNQMNSDDGGQVTGYKKASSNSTQEMFSPA